MRDLLVSSGVTYWGDEEEAAWLSNEAIDGLLHYWAYLLAERGQDVFEQVADLRPGHVWGLSHPAACEMFYSYLDEVARVNKA